MDRVFINDLRIDTIIGIYDWERKVRQTISLDLEMGTDIRHSAKTDAIEDTLNYKAVAKRLIAFVGDGAIIMGGTHIGEQSIIAAGTLVPRGMEIPPRSFVRGRPARVVREVTEEELSFGKNEAVRQMELASKSE